MLKKIGSACAVLALAMVFGVAAQAQTPAPKPAATAKPAAAHEINGMGTVTSVDATHLMITHKVNGKEAPMTLVLTPETKKAGNVAAGSKVSVKYHMENGDAVATSVTASAATTAKAKTPKAPAAKKS